MAVLNKYINKIKTKEFWINLIQEIIVDLILIIIGIMLGYIIKINMF